MYDLNGYRRKVIWEDGRELSNTMEIEVAYCWEKSLGRVNWGIAHSQKINKVAHENVW